jgi:hypothetical protein
VISIEPATLEKKIESYKLQLVAKRASESHKTISLWVDKVTYAPLLAHYFFNSGNLARTVYFGPIGNVRGAKVITGMSLKDLKGNEIHLNFASWQPYTPKAEDFELPQFGKTAKNN